MAATYDPTLPTAKDRVRYALGDTNVAAALEQDETYVANLTLYSESLAIAVMAEALAARFAQKPDSFGTDGLNVTWRERVKTWLALATTMRANATAAAGSAASSFVATRNDDTDAEYVRFTADYGWWST